MNDDNPYQAPRASVVPSSLHSPFRFQPDQPISLQVADLRRVGWLSLLSAAITLPYCGLWIYVASATHHPLEELAVLLELMLTVVGIIILQKFRRLLHDRSRFHGADAAIRWLIRLGILLATFSLVQTLFAMDANGLVMLNLLSSMVYGGLLIALGRRLLTCPDDLYGRLKPLAYLLLSSGVLIATLFLAVLSALTSVVSDLLFAAIFFSAATELAEVQAAAKLTPDVASSSE